MSERKINLEEILNNCVYIDDEIKPMVKHDLEVMRALNKCYVLDIPDIYSFNDPDLIAICEKQYEDKVLNNTPT